MKNTQTMCFLPASFKMNFDPESISNIFLPRNVDFRFPLLLLLLLKKDISNYSLCVEM